jgi:hypothetical protein
VFANLERAVEILVEHGSVSKEAVSLSSLLVLHVCIRQAFHLQHDFHIEHSHQFTFFAMHDHLSEEKKGKQDEGRSWTNSVRGEPLCDIIVCHLRRRPAPPPQSFSSSHHGKMFSTKICRCRFVYLCRSAGVCFCFTFHGTFAASIDNKQLFLHVAVAGMPRDESQQKHRHGDD